MAELHDNGWSKNRDNRNDMAPLGSWSRSESDDTGPRNPIEVHGNAYIAFCQPWAPLWIDPEEESDLD
jgi:hypothetical protein